MKNAKDTPANPARRRIMTHTATSMLGMGLGATLAGNLGAAESLTGGGSDTESLGGLISLVAYGAQDVYLTGNPQMTFFKDVYKRHSNFSLEHIALSLDGKVDFGSSNSVTITRNGDLVHHMWLQVVLEPVLDSHGNPAEISVVDSLGHALLKSVELDIGGLRIDRHTSDWLEIVKEVSLDDSKKAGYEMMINGIGDGGEVTLYIPLQFFFNRHAGLALPLIALQYHEVTLHFEFESLDKLVSIDGVPGIGNYTTGIKDAQLLVEYVFLDSEERRQFAQVGHEYLIEQVQYMGEMPLESPTSKFVLDFKQSVKALYWVLEDAYAIETGQSMQYADGLEYARLSFNGQERFEKSPGSYFRMVQPYQTHSRIPTKPVYMYSFALHPEDYQPSGTSNFSKIDNAQLEIWTKAGFELPGRIKIFAVNYNVLRIMSGMGGLAYSN